MGLPIPCCATACKITDRCLYYFLQGTEEKIESRVRKPNRENSMRMKVLVFLATITVYGPANAYDWQTPLIWDWVLTTANPQLTQHDSDIAALQAENANLNATILDLESKLAALQGEVATLAANSVLTLDGHVSLDTTDPTRPAVVVSAANLQVVNGTGVSWNAANGVGNIIIGYDEFRPSSHPPVCSSGQYDNQTDCEASGATWAVQHKSGSHNLVVGYWHNYSSLHGIVGGQRNTINSEESVVITGNSNIASGQSSVILAGFGHVSSGTNSTITGGSSNISSGQNSSISGGAFNESAGNWSTITGGSNNTTGGLDSSVSGGLNRSAVGTGDWVAGSLFEDN
jgi:hypothetical protein